jgi:hypothetical protein
VILVVNPMVPVNVGSVPTGHGTRTSVRDKGMMWVTNQAIRMGIHKLMRETCARVIASGKADILLIEPEPTDGILFMHNPASFAARRKILEYAYRTTRTRMAEWFRIGEPALKRAGWRMRAGAESAALPAEEGT